MPSVFDISMPIRSPMWSYREQWHNEITLLADTLAGDPSTVYRFSLCSHTGTYIETSQHKLRTVRPLDALTVASFHRPCKLLTVTPVGSRGVLTRAAVSAALNDHGMQLDEGDAFILATGWGKHSTRPDYLTASPYFERDLTEYLASHGLGLLGVDVPVIDDQEQPYGAVTALFEACDSLLLLAPLVIDTDQIRAGTYVLSSPPLNIVGACASLCRPILIAGV